MDGYRTFHTHNTISNYFVSYMYCAKNTHGWMDTQSHTHTYTHAHTHTHTHTQRERERETVTRQTQLCLSKEERCPK